LLASESVVAFHLRFLGSLSLDRSRSLQRRKAIEEQLGDVSEGNRVAAGDAFAGELFNEISEKEIDGSGGGEILDVTEEVGGEDFRIDGGNGGAETVGVVSADLWIRGTSRGTMELSKK
jgi:hypothetical protein